VQTFLLFFSQMMHKLNFFREKIISVRKCVSVSI